MPEGPALAVTLLLDDAEGRHVVFHHERPDAFHAEIRKRMVDQKRLRLRAEPPAVPINRTHFFNSIPVRGLTQFAVYVGLGWTP
jgi:hypothetical protein